MQELGNLAQVVRRAGWRVAMARQVQGEDLAVRLQDREFATQRVPVPPIEGESVKQNDWR